MTTYRQLRSDLTVHWIIVVTMLILLIGYNIVCHVMASDIQIYLEQQQRILIRTILYAIAIILFPLASLMRHIFIRLNQTMPGSTPAKNRYLITIVVSLCIIETVGLFGFIMFILGDDYNTLYIFSVMSLLGIYLHRPKLEEYEQIIEALREQKLNL